MKGLPWLQEGCGNSVWDDYAPGILDATLNTTYFENSNFTMEVLQENTVSFRYKFKDFQGTTEVFAPWEALLETRCQRFNTTSSVDLPLLSLNTTTYPPMGGDYRWISRHDNSSREKPTQLCKSSAFNYIRSDNLLLVIL